MNSDLLGGLLMCLGGVFQAFSVAKAYSQKQVRGVSPWMMLYFLCLNMYYVWLLWTTGLVYSAAGMVPVSITSLVWFFQYLHYEAKIVAKIKGLFSS